MIEKMKKLTFLVTSKEYDSFLQEIRELGVVHIAELQNGGSSPELQEALAYSERCRQALNTLKRASDNYTTDKLTALWTKSTGLRCANQTLSVL